MEKERFEKLAWEWLKQHYPDKQEPIDIKYSAVLNFAIYLDNLLERRNMDYPNVANSGSGLVRPAQESLLGLSADVLNLIQEIEMKLKIQLPETADKLGSDAPLDLVMEDLRRSRNKLQGILGELGKI